MVKLNRLVWGVSCIALSLQADPTRPPGWGVAETAAPAVPVLQVQQIVLQGNRAVAIINEQLVRPGDQVDGALVLAVHPDRVLVRVRNQQQELTLFTMPDIKRNSP